MVKLRKYILLLALGSWLLTPLRAEVSFRGAWIATVANIDWPSEEAVGNTEMQQQEMMWLLPRKE